MFKRVLIANRGEIAVRIIRTLREMGIASVAAFSDADRDALFALEADEAYRLGPAPAAQSYLDSDAILAVAREARVEAIHPGYGFLAENPGFVRAVTEAGFTFIGPPAEAMAVMGDKVAARQAVQRLGVRVVPGTDGPVESLDEVLAFAQEAGYPIAVKAAGGGGGRGIRVVRSPEEMETAVETAQREAGTYFKNSEVYLEKYFDSPRHVEIQVLGDAHGNLVHLGERDCSVQRRHQKLIEETPSPAVNRDLRERMGDMAVDAARAVNYRSAGTVECLLTLEGDFYFLEMNTRIQVEHPVTEMVTGVDLIREMVLVAAGEPQSVKQSLLDLNGHAIEVRVNAEDAQQDFRATPATIERYREPGGIGVRIDSGVYQGFTIPSHYDSLVAKAIVWAPDRDWGIQRMLRALDEYVITGPCTTIPFSKAVLSSPQFASGSASTAFVGRHLEELKARATALGGGNKLPVANRKEGSERSDARTFEVEVNRRLFRVQVAELLQCKKRSTTRPRREARKPSATAGEILSPMHGLVLRVDKQPGDEVAEGDTLLVIEAMKMENEIRAARAGTVKAVHVQVGETVENAQPLAEIG